MNGLNKSRRKWKGRNNRNRARLRRLRVMIVVVVIVITTTTKKYEYDDNDEMLMFCVRFLFIIRSQVLPICTNAWKTCYDRTVYDSHGRTPFDATLHPAWSTTGRTVRQSRNWTPIVGVCTEKCASPLKHMRTMLT